jgi:hypothetical protein
MHSLLKAFCYAKAGGIFYVKNHAKCRKLHELAVRRLYRPMPESGGFAIIRTKIPIFRRGDVT